MSPVLYMSSEEGWFESQQAPAEPQVAKIPGSEGACYGSAVVVQDARNASVLWAFATPNGPAVRPRKQHSPPFHPPD